jgi:hypothetical protein
MAELTKQEAQKFLSNVSDPQIYWCRDGRSISNLKQLEGVLDTLDVDTYFFHASPERKNFSAWVQDVIGDKKLAEDLSKAQSLEQAQSAVENRVDLLETAVAS